MSEDILAIHGIGNFEVEGPQAATRRLSAAWTRAVRTSLRQVAFPRAAAVRVRMAYWADLVRTPEAADGVVAASIEPDGAALGAPGPDGAAQVEPSAAAMALHGLGVLAERLGNLRGEDVAGLLRLAELREIAARWERVRGRSLRSRELVAILAFDEVSNFLSEQAMREACRDRVEAELRRVRPRVVVAHSLGSVLAYEALHRASDVPVELLVTLGSPLGAPNSVLPTLDPAPVDGQGRRPDNVARWVNIADPSDIVPFVQDLAPSFRGVDADLHPSIGPRGSHEALRYLASPTTAAVLVQHLG